MVGEISEGIPVCMVEQTQRNRFNMFLDIDIKSDSLDVSLLHPLLTLCHRRIGGGDAMVATCFREKKQGIHIVFPHKQVNSREARGLLTRLVQDLNNRREFDGYNWAEFMDSRPYGTGFRMIFNHKYNKASNSYDIPYIPYKLVNEDGIHDIHGSPQELLEKFSIHDTTSELNPHVDVGRVDLQEGNILERFLHTYHHKNLRVTKLIMRKNSHSIITTCRYCTRVQREHRGNHVWFRMIDGILHSECTDDECSGYEGRRISIPPRIVEFIKSHSIPGNS